MAQTSPDPSDVRKEEDFSNQGWQGHPVVVVSATHGRGRHFSETSAVALVLQEGWLAASTAPLQYPLIHSVLLPLHPTSGWDMLVLLATNYSLAGSTGG